MARAPAASKGCLPCPFYRRKPGAYAACARFRAKQPRYIKPHLFQHHCRPLHYCPTCGDSSFTTAAQCDSHIKEAQCVAPPEGVPPIDGLDQNQVAQIAGHNARRGQGETETWLQYYDIAFPNECRPTSVLMSGVPEVEEAVAMTGEHWHAHRQTIIAAIVASHPPTEQPWPAAVIGAIGDDVVESLLSSLLDQNGAANGRTAPAFSLDPAAAPDVFCSGMADAAEVAEAANALGPQLNVDGPQPFIGLPFNAGPQPFTGPTFDADFTFDTDMAFNAVIDPLLLTSDHNAVATPSVSRFDVDFLEPSVRPDNLDPAHLSLRFGQYLEAPALGPFNSPTIGLSSPTIGPGPGDGMQCEFGCGSAVSCRGHGGV